MKILIVEDDEVTRSLVKTVLSDAGHQLHEVDNGSGALQAIDADAVEMFILDLQLPDMNGVDVCRAVRKTSTAYILVLSGHHEEEIKVSALLAGADDYLSKPFSPRELVARVEAMQRRPRVSVPVARGLKLDEIARTVSFEDRPIKVTAIEFRLLWVLAAAAPSFVARKDLIEAAWGLDTADDLHVVDVHLSNLRRKFRAAGAPETCIDNERGFGFRLLLP